MSKLQIKIPKTSSYTYLELCQQIDRAMAKQFVELEIFPADFIGCRKAWIPFLALFRERGYNLVDPGRKPTKKCKVQELAYLIVQIHREADDMSHEEILEALESGLVIENPIRAEINSGTGEKVLRSIDIQKFVERAVECLPREKKGSEYKRFMDLKGDGNFVEEANRYVNNMRVEREKEFAHCENKAEFKFTQHFFERELERVISNTPSRLPQIQAYVEELLGLDQGK